MAGTIDPIATFLGHVEPWATGTYVNIEAYDWVPKAGGNPGEGTLSHQKGSRAARDLQEAANFIRWQDGLGREVYIRMGSVKNPGVGKADKLGRAFHRALSGRANAAMAKSFFIDVDVKPGKHASTQEAQAAVSAMCSSIGLPLPSLAVSSGGGGFHAHWVLDKPITADDWDLVAPMLAEACRRHGVHADHNLTVNTVCLLRVPGTHNRKYGAPRAVTMQVLGPAVDIDRMLVALAPFYDPAKKPSGPQPGASPSFSVDPLIFPAKPGVGLDERWTDGISSAAFTIEEVAAGCPHIKETLETGGAGQFEPLWFDAGHVALFTVKEIEDFHRLSKGHRSYTHDETDAKFSQILKSKREKNLGWPRCQTFHNDDAAKCKTCPHLAKNKSPLNFAVRKLEERVTPPGNPQGPGDSGDNQGTQRPPLFSSIAVEGYNYDAANGVYSYPVTDKKTGDSFFLPLHSFPIHDLKYLEGADGQWATHFDTWMAQRQPVHIVIRTKQEVDNRALTDCLSGDYGLPFHPDAGKELRIFMAAFKDQMRRTRDTIERQEHMGWTDDGGKTAAFIYGKWKYNCKGNTPYYQADSFVREHYSPTGSIEPWMLAIHMINAEQRPEMDFLVATAFGAPLMRFTPEKGVVISAFSSSTAAHKSTALKIGQAVWGDFMGINQLKDTQNNLMARVGKGRIVPTYFDEMRSSLDIKAFAAMIYMLAGGRGKGRLNRNAEIKNVDTWDTLLVGASNDSLFDHIAQIDQGTDAGVSRIFEFEIMPPAPGSPGQISTAMAGSLLKKLEVNYGRAGERYAEHLGKSVEWLPDAVIARVLKLEKDLGAPQSERFWLSAAAAVLVGAEQANTIGLTHFDIGRMEVFVAQTFTKMRAARLSGDLDISKKENLRATLSNYVNAHRRETLATDIAGQGGRAGALNPVQVLNMIDLHSTPRFVLRYIQDPKPVLRISRSALTQYFKLQQMPAAAIIRNIMGHYGAKQLDNANITSGTARASSGEKLIELDLTHPDLNGLYVID